ncbi:Amine oxidase [Pseudomonas sp. IT-P253]
MPRFQVVPPQQIKIVQGIVAKDDDWTPAFVAINYHIIDSQTGAYTGDHFEHEEDAEARARALNQAVEQ